MASSVTGVSTLDVNSIVSQLMTIERRPVTLLDQKEAGLQAKVSGYGALKGAISMFQSAMQGLQTPAKFTANTLNVSDATVLSATAASSAAAGVYEIDVANTATAHVMKSAAVVSDLDSGSTGTVSIQVGSGAIKTVTVDASNNTLRGLRDAINSADAGVRASIVHDGSGYRLVTTANKSGAANTISVTHTLSSGVLKDALDGATQARAAQNAQFTVNGVAVSSESNTASDAITGVTLNLVKTGSSRVTVAADTAQAQAAVQSFVTAYNDLNRIVTDLTKYDSATKRSGILNGDSSAAALLSGVRRELGAALPGLSGRYTNLSQIGVSFQRDGTLALDANKLKTALAGSSDDVAALFARRGTSDNALLSYVGSSAATSAGAWSVDITAAATRGTATGTSAVAATTLIDSTNDTFSALVDGIDSGNVRLAHGTYNATQLAALMQGALNGANAFASSKIEVAVTAGGTGQLSVQSRAYGAISSIAAVSGSAGAALGFDGSETGAGTNVAGVVTLNGGSFTGTGQGQTLTGPAGGAAEGLSVRYAGAASQVAAGSEGTVNVSEGYAARLAKLADQALATQGIVQSKTDGLARSIKDINSRRETLNVRLVGIEKRLRAQFVSLDSLVTRLNSTSTFLNQQLANLPKSQ